MLVIPAGDPTGAPVVVAPRRQGVEYAVEHHGDRFLILHNDGAEDFALAFTSADAPGDWVPLIEHTPGTGCEAWTPSPATWWSRCAATASPALRVLPVRQRRAVRHRLPRAAVQRRPGRQRRVPRPPRSGCSYTSLVTPDSVYDYDLVTRRDGAAQAAAGARAGR